MQAPMLLRIYLVLTAIVVVKEVKLTQADSSQAFKTIMFLVISHATALFDSMIIYRIFFHRLRNFLGSSVARMTKL